MMFVVNANSGGVQPLNAYIAELYFNSDTTLDLSNPANIWKFRKNRRPADLGRNGFRPTGAQPVIYCRGPIAEQFTTNRGYGGNYTHLRAR